MKAPGILFLLLSLPIIVFSQPEIKKVTIKNDKLNILESFYVLKTNPDIRHGDYEKYQDYSLIEKGTYEYGKKLVWTFYDLRSHVVIKYDFSKDSLMSINFALRNFEIYSENKEKIIVEQPAIPLVTDSEMYRYISRYIQYPEKARKSLIEGTVKIGIQIDNLGNIKNYEVIQKINPLLDEEALKVIKSFPSDWKWLPSMNDGNKITSYYVIPIKFKLI
jgi:TonB family protein